MLNCVALRSGACFNFGVGGDTHANSTQTRPPNMSASPSSSFETLASPSGLRERKPAANDDDKSDAPDYINSIEPFLEEEHTTTRSQSGLPSIEWAPLEVPMHRRLQTTAVLLSRFQ